MYETPSKRLSKSQMKPKTFKTTRQPAPQALCLDDSERMAY